MEQVRLIIALTLCVVVFIAWGHFFGPKPGDRIAQQAQEESLPQPGSRPDPAMPPAALTPPPAPQAGMEQQAVEAAPERIITVETPLFVAQLSSQGATLVHLLLKDYRKTNEADSPPKELVVLPANMGTLETELADGSTPGLAGAVFNVSADGDLLVVDNANGNREVVFFWTSPYGVKVEKKFVFRPDAYVMDLVVTVYNGSGGPLSDRLGVTLVSQMEQVSRYGFEGPVALLDRRLEEIKIGKVRKDGLLAKEGNIGFSGIMTRYFLSALIPETAQNASMRFTPREASVIAATLIHPRMVLAPGQQQVFAHQAYFGPKSPHMLKQGGELLTKALNFGWFDIIAKPCLLLMIWIHDSLIPNYGVAIILITILVKLLFWPLSNKSYRSMNQMKKLAPLMQEIREKHKDDKRKMNEEVFALYRTYKVNPMSGCLPMLLQIPVFIALYKMLYGAIELRHAPFMLWINDLSAPDRLFTFLNIPFIEPPGLPVLTLIMGASMFLQQKMAPPPADPMQAKMMMALPIVFTFIFIGFPSGLVLYWLVNNLLSMAQQYYIQKKAD
ncbi:MAG: membrane protein insertase YidC [Desulfatibacillaceae bacterium]|nr:membrane protein insertase YidC [Desulfatibacillaceae bacterium]